MITMLVLVSAALAQVAGNANSGYKTPEGRERVAKTLTAPDRDAKQKPEELVRAMAIKPGMVVADIGTGAGYMLPFVAKFFAGINGYDLLSPVHGGKQIGRIYFKVQFIFVMFDLCIHGVSFCQ